MKIFFIWVLLSSTLSLAIVLNAHKVIPVGEHTERSIVSNTELYTLKELLKNETITKSDIQSLINKKQRPFKANVIAAQIELIPTSFIYIALLILNSLNILFVLTSFWYFRNKAGLKRET